MEDNPQYKHVIKYGTIEIGDWSFVGSGSRIMPGVKIGSHSVIGAGSLVTHDVPDNSVVVGIPARVICTTEEYAEKCRIKFEKEFPDFDEKAYFSNKRKYLTEHFFGTKH